MRRDGFEAKVYEPSHEAFCNIMTNRQIDYDVMVQDALLAVVKKLLAEASKNGLPGNHHFYIAFNTGFPGVVIPPHLRAKYPDEMTIVLQNQFWDLMVFDDHFEVGLSFNQKSETLVIPFAALTGFLDPSVEFGLQFQRKNQSKKEAKAPAAIPKAPAPKAAVAAPEKPAEKVVTLDAFRKKK